MKRVYFILIYLVFWGYVSGQSSTVYDVEFSRICLIDSISPSSKVQFWRFTHANNPGEYIVDITFDLSSTYTPTGTLVKCCSCLSAASDTASADFDRENDPIYATGGNWKHTLFGIFVLFCGVLILRREKMASRIACTLFVLALGPYTQISAQSETRYDVEFSCICLVDSIGPTNVVQFYRFTQANNPGEYTVDVTYDLSSTYTPAGTVLGCNDYYLGDNPGGTGTLGTLAIWTGTNSLGNSSVTESGQIIASSLTGALKVPSGTDAEVPVWAAGQLRYNTTGGGFQGGANGYYLPFSNSPTFTSGSVIYSNGTRIVEDNSGIYFDQSDNELRIGGTTDRGAFDLQLNEQGIYIESAFPAIRIKNGRISFDGSTIGAIQATNCSMAEPFLDIVHTNTGATCPPIRAYGYTPTQLGNINNASSGDVALLLSYRKQAVNGEYELIRLGVESSIGETVTNGQQVNLNGGLSQNWSYRRGTDYRYIAAKIVPVVIDNTLNSQDVALKFYKSRNNVLTETFRLDSTSIFAYQYGGGSVIGTPAVQNISVESGGKLIERKFAYAEMYVTDTDPDTVTFLAGSTTPDQPTDLTAGELANFTYSAGRLTYTGAETAKFLINTSISFSFSEGSIEIEGWIYKSGAEVSKSEMHRKIGTGGDVGNGGQTCIVELATNNYIEIFFAPAAHTGDDDLIITNMNINLIKI